MLEALLHVPEILNCSSKPPSPSWDPLGRHRWAGTLPGIFPEDSLATATMKRTQKELSEQLLALDGTRDEKIAP